MKRLYMDINDINERTHFTLYESTVEQMTRFKIRDLIHIALLDSNKTT